jgi:hypothetical protein
VALRKTETSHHLSLDKANIPPEIFQKSSQLAELPQKPPPGDLPPKPTELAPKPQIGDLPPKPGELPPKPQLGDLPPKPQLSDLPPKPQVKDLPPKPQLGDLLAKSQTGDVSPKTQQPSDIMQKSHPADLSPNVQSRDTIQKQTSEESNDLTPTLPETPVPLPRKINTVGGHRCSGTSNPQLHFFFFLLQCRRTNPELVHARQALALSCIPHSAAVLKVGRVHVLQLAQENRLLLTNLAAFLCSGTSTTVGWSLVVVRNAGFGLPVGRL